MPECQQKFNLVRGQYCRNVRLFCALPGGQFHRNRGSVSPEQGVNLNRNIHPYKGKAVLAAKMKAKKNLHGRKYAGKNWGSTLNCALVASPDG